MICNIISPNSDLGCQAVRSGGDPVMSDGLNIKEEQNTRLETKQNGMRRCVRVVQDLPLQFVRVVMDYMQA